MDRQKLYKILNILLPISTLLLILIIYAIISKAVGIDMLVPSVPSTIKELIGLFGKKSFYTAVFWTLLRAFIAYFSAIVVAGILAVLTYVFKPLKSAMSPIIILIRIMPTMSLILLALIWFDSFEATVLVAFSVVFPMLYTAFADALESVDNELIEMARIYEVDKKTKIFKLYLPQMSSGIFTGIRSSIGLNLKLIIAAEVLAQTADSMGIYMQFAKINLDTAELIAWTIVAILLGAFFEGIVKLIEKKVVKWK